MIGFFALNLAVVPCAKYAQRSYVDLKFVLNVINLS